MIARLLLAIAALTVGAEAALACSCSRDPLIEEFLDADLFFEGEALSTRALASNDAAPMGAVTITAEPFEPTLETLFRVTAADKGAPREERWIKHWADDGGNCGVQFEPGTTYLFAAHRRGD
ncbi:MAG: hypothetical protein AAF869_11225, partial [Pseudomonadota bacterium]